MNRYGAQGRFLRICPEDAWGQCPAEPAWTAVPFLADGLRLGPTRPHYAPDTLFGGWRRSAVLSTGMTVAGTLQTWLWPETAGLLMGMALDRDVGGPASYCLDVYAPPAPQRCTGVMVSEFELRRLHTSDDVAVRLAVRGRDEEPNPALAPGDFAHFAVSPVPFRFAAARVELGGCDMTDVEEFTIRVDNGLVAGPLRYGLRAFLAAGPRTFGLDLISVHDSEALAQAVREDEALAFVLELAHPEGHTLSVEMPCLHPERTGRRAHERGPVRESVRLVGATGASGTDIEWSLNLIA